MSESIILQVTPIRIYDNRSAMYVVTLAGWKCNCCSQLQRCCAWFLADKVRFHFVFSFLFSTRNFIRKSLYHVCLLLVSKPTFAVMYNQGKPVEDACSATCSSSSYTLIIFAGPETDISTQFIYLNTHPCKDVYQCFWSICFIYSFIFCYLAWDLCDPCRLRFVALAHVELDGTSRFRKILCMIAS